MNREVVNKTRQFFRQQKGIVAVYLYGSYAKDLATKASDLDLAVFFEEPNENSKRTLELGVKLQQLLGNKFRVDLRQIHLGLSPVFLGEVIGQGKVIFCRNEEQRVKFEVAALRIIDDSEQIRKINLYHLQKSIREDRYGRA